jgi:RNA polymerase sigma-70 factor, ECF subfamily
VNVQADRVETASQLAMPTEPLPKAAVTPRKSTQLPGRQPADDHERELLQRIEMQDREALRRLHLLYYDRLSRFLRRITRRLAVVDEVINDTFVIVWRKAGDFRGDSLVSTWIIGIAYRKALSALRAERRAEALLVAPLGEEQQPSTVTGESTDNFELLGRAMECLSAEHRAVMELTYYCGYSCEEIATIMQCPANTVKTRMFHARNKLRVLIPVLAAPVN